MLSKPNILKSDGAALTAACNFLTQGRLVAFPTETVYGLGADARNVEAVARIYKAKGRPSFNPLIVHVATVEAAQSFVAWNEMAERLASAFWPGPLTMVLPIKTDTPLAPAVTAGLPSVAIRIPGHQVSLDLLRHFDGPLAAPSANPSGKISPTTAAHVADGLGDLVDMIIDDGPCAVGLESTIIGLVDTPKLLRPGGIPTEDVERAIGQPLGSDLDNDITAPGQLASHYAPETAIRLNAYEALNGELFLGFGAMECDLNLSPSGNLAQAASNLFGHLHELDEKSATRIAVAPIPDVGIGAAINDRLRRAAAPRE
ncbi:MAG: L-threonylcarbamoyladenylate synthase [Pseudomonadota bacterium]